MSNNKTIQFNPVFFSGSGKVKSPTNKREKKEKPQVSVKPNKMKKQLLAKIKDFQNNTEKAAIRNEKTKEEEEFDQGFADEFNKSLNFLSELSKQRKQKPNRNETLKKGKVEHAVHLQISTELPEDLKVTTAPPPPPIKITTLPKVIPTKAKVPVPIQQAPIQQAPIQAMPLQVMTTQATHTMSLKPTPVYSNLKGGTRPTYRQYHNKTQKNYGNEAAIKPLIHIAQETTIMVKKPRFKKRTTRTLKYSLGKHKNGKVSVLIKNAKTRRKVQTEQALLKQKSIADIKLYLRSKNLLKVGSEVPNDVLRQMYESAILAGDVTNKSKDTLIHNFLNDK